MFLRGNNLSRRDTFLVLFGACSMHILSFLFPSRQVTSQSTATVIINQPALPASVVPTRINANAGVVSEPTAAAYPYPSSPTHITQSVALRPTTVLAHAPGWTLFQDLYMSNGTLFLIIPNSSYTPSKGDSYGTTKVDGLFPEVRMMTSAGLIAFNTPENIAQREPTEREMRFMSIFEAGEMWGKEGEEKRVWTVDGNTLLFNDPPQFLRHYYHFVAGLFLGVQAFWHGFFSSPTSHDPESSIQTHPAAPPLHRAIFIHSNADGWRDDPGFNSYFLRAAFPSLTVEHREDWDDRVKASTSKTRAWRFPLALLADRSAAHRGVICGSRTQRTAAEAWEYMRVRGSLRGMSVGGWWNPVREAIWRFAGVNLSVVLPLDEGSSVDLEEVPKASRPGDVPEGENEKMLPMPEKVVITYISRQSAHKRKLLKEDHEALVKELTALVARKNAEREERQKKVEAELVKDGEGNGGGVESEATSESSQLEWELQVLEAEHMTKDDQVRAASRTTILLGVHGNGLTHLVFMPPTRLSTVIEIFCPPGFAHDYQWTTRALGMKYFGVWNDTYFTDDPEPEVRYPECFQGDGIRVSAGVVVRVVEERVGGSGGV